MPRTMDEIVGRAIDVSRGSLIFRPREDTQKAAFPYRLPQGIQAFFGAVSAGILFPDRSPRGEILNGFEILDSTLLYTVNELLGDVLTLECEPDYFDSCRVLFSAVADQCLLFGVDLNENHFGWIFIADINPGNNPAEGSFYAATSFESWLELNMRSETEENSERVFRRDSALGPLGA